MDVIASQLVIPLRPADREIVCVVAPPHMTAAVAKCHHVRRVLEAAMAGKPPDLHAPKRGPNRLVPIGATPRTCTWV